MQTITLHTSESVKAQIRQPNQPPQTKLQSGTKPQSGVTLVNGLAGVGIVVGLFAAVLPAPSAIAANDYERCTTDLLGSKISTDEASSACARALFPRDIARCVNDISGSAITAVDALSACRQVRRPRELATCVVDIRREISDSTAAEVLDSCRRSLLPVRYSDCVIGLNKAAKVPASKALDSCIDANYLPREVDPTFLPFAPSGGVSATPTQSQTTMPSTSPTLTPFTSPATPSPSPSPAPATPSEPIPQRY